MSDEQALLQVYRARQQPEHLLKNLEKMRRAGQVSDDTYASLRQEYLAAIDSVDSEIARQRDALSHELLHTREEVISKLHEREEADRQYHSGELNKSAYQKAIKALDGELASLDARCKHLEALLAAETTSKLEHVLTPTASKSKPPSSKASRPPKDDSHARHRPPARLLLVGLLAVAFVTVGLWGVPQLTRLLPSADNNDDGAVRQFSLVAGNRVDVMPQKMVRPGETLSVIGTGTPLDGMSIEMPPDAYAAPLTFDIGYSPIEELDAGGGVESITPLIHVDAQTDDYAEDPIALTMPVDVPEGHFAMAFIYDKVLGLLHPLPTLEEADGTLTVFTRHFCPVVLLSAPFERFLSESIQQPGNLKAVKIDTEFLPGRDTWNLVNAGSSLAPGGFCHGMSLTSLYHYVVERQITGDALWKDEYDNGLPEGMGTPGFWQDDRWAIELCSAVNGLSPTQQTGRVMDGIAARVNGLTPDRKLQNLERQFYMTAFALYVTKAPQLLDVHSSAGGGHSLLCYGIDGTTLFIADPNYPDKTNIRMQYADGKLGPYDSAQSVQDILAGNLKKYDRIFYQGDISFFNVGKLDVLWTDYDSGTLNAGFPRYTIKATELNENGAPVRTYELDRDLSNRSATRRLRFELDPVPDRNLRLYVYEYGHPPTLAVPLNEVSLAEGDNYLGFHVEEEVVVDKKTGKKAWQWAGFDWVQIYMPREDEASRSYLCWIEVEFECVPVTDDFGIEGVTSWSMETQAYGRLAGGEFTADWTEDYGGGTLETGHIAVLVDPDMELVKSYEFWEEYDDGNPSDYCFYGASGAGLELAWYSDPSEGGYVFWGSTEGDMPPPQIEWKQEGIALTEPKNFVVHVSLAEMEATDDSIPRG